MRAIWLIERSANEQISPRIVSRSLGSYIALVVALLLPVACTNQSGPQALPPYGETTVTEQAIGRNRAYTSGKIDELQQFLLEDRVEYFEGPVLSESAEANRPPLATDNTSEVQTSHNLLAEEPPNLAFDVVAGEEIVGKEEDISGEEKPTSQGDGQVAIQSSPTFEAGDEAVLVFDSIARQGCVVRGMIRNSSGSLYARNVTVTLREKEGNRQSKFHWPLTINPGENAPFEVSINWFPDRLVEHLPWFEDSLPRLEPWANLDRIISADISSVPDYRRAIEINADETEYIPLFQTGHNFLVYDERVYELEAYKQMKPYGREYSFATTPAIATLLPPSFTVGKDVELMLGSIGLYKYWDIYYTPDTVAELDKIERYPDTLGDVRVFQAVVDGSEVIDIWELLPYSISEEVNSKGRLIGRHFNPVDTLQRYSEDEEIEEVFVGVLSPYGPSTQFPNRNFEGLDATHAGDGQQFGRRLWWGGVSHEAVSLSHDPLEGSVYSDGSYCSTDGGFTKDDWQLGGQIPYLYTNPLGFTGRYDYYQPGIPPTDEIVVDTNSVLVTGNSVRGLVRNLSDGRIARRVRVAVVLPNGDTTGDVWHWPLSVQPGERAPFEITMLEPDIPVQDLVFEISAEFAETVDLTRSLSLDIYDAGRIYGEKFRHLYASEQLEGVDPGDYLDEDGIWHLPKRQYLEEEFLEMYGDISIVEDLAEADLFQFVDFYARLEVPDSHPDLKNFVRKQYIGALQAFAATLDSEARVVSVHRLQPFTPVYGPTNVNQRYVAVDSIPVPNRWSPDAVRLLLTIPFADEAERQQGYDYQIWIGGAVDGG